MPYIDPIEKLLQRPTITGTILTETHGNDTGLARPGHASVTILGVIEVPNDHVLNSLHQQHGVSGRAALAERVCYRYDQIRRASRARS